jgi:hypothetical protein
MITRDKVDLLLKELNVIEISGQSGVSIEVVREIMEGDKELDPDVASAISDLYDKYADAINPKSCTKYPGFYKNPGVNPFYYVGNDPVIEVILSCDQEFQERANSASDWNWRFRGKEDDIVAWRIQCSQ